VKRKPSVPQFLALVVLLLSAGATEAASPSAAVSLSATEFGAGNTLTVGIQAANPAGNPGADLYVGVVLADGITALFFQADGGSSPPIALTDAARFVPFQPAPPGYMLSTPLFFRYTFPAAGVPPGTYRFFAALVRQGGLLDGRLDAGDVLVFVQFDPFGWDSPEADPWALHPEGAPSAWLWKAGQAPEIFKETRLAANPGSGDAASVAITALRIMGWQDALRPNNEFVELTLDQRFAPTGVFDLTGFRVRNNRGTSFSFPAGFVIRAGRPVRVFSGVGINTETELFWGSSQPVWDDADNCAHLVRPSGSNMYRLTYGVECN